MVRRLALILLAASLLLPACKEETIKPVLSPEEKELLRTKADEKIGVIITENLPALFAGIVAFDKDAFAYQSHMLDEAEISVLNTFGKSAILLLNSPNIIPLMKQKSVKKVSYLCRQGALVRLDTPFEMELMRRYGEGKEGEKIAFMIRFKETPDEKDRKKGELDTKLVEGAGFKIVTKAGLVCTLEGPLSSVPRLLEYDGIVFYEIASKTKKM